MFTGSVCASVRASVTAATYRLHDTHRMEVGERLREGRRSDVQVADDQNVLSPHELCS